MAPIIDYYRTRRSSSTSSDEDYYTRPLRPSIKRRRTSLLLDDIDDGAADDYPYPTYNRSTALTKYTTIEPSTSLAHPTASPRVRSHTLYKYEPTSSSYSSNYAYNEEYERESKYSYYHREYDCDDYPCAKPDRKWEFRYSSSAPKTRTVAPAVEYERRKLIEYPAMEERGRFKVRHVKAREEDDDDEVEWRGGRSVSVRRGRSRSRMRTREVSIGRGYGEGEGDWKPLRLFRKG